MNSKEYAEIRGRSPAWVTAQIKDGMPATNGGRSGKDYAIDPVAAMRWELERKPREPGAPEPMPPCLRPFGGNFLRLLTWELCKSLSYTVPQCLAIAVETDTWSKDFGLSDEQMGALMARVWITNAQVLQHFLQRNHDSWFRDIFGYDIDVAAEKMWPARGLAKMPKPAPVFIDEVGEMPPAVKKLFTEGAQALIASAPRASAVSSAQA